MYGFRSLDKARAPQIDREIPQKTSPNDRLCGVIADAVVRRKVR